MSLEKTKTQRQSVFGKDTLRLFPIWAKFYFLLVVVSLEKTLYAYFLFGPSRLLVVVALFDEKLQKEPKKGCSALVWLDKRKVPGSYERML